MQLSEIITLTRDLVNEPSDTTILSDTTVTRFLNSRYNQINNKIIDVNESFFGRIDQTIDLVADQQQYSLPDTDSNSVTRVTRIRRMEIAYDGSNFNEVIPLAIQEIPESNWVSTIYTQNNPRYYLWGDEIYFDPVPSAAATNAVKLWYIQRQDELENDSDRPAFPEQYHYILAYGAAADIKMREGSAVVDTDDIPFVDRFEAKFNEGLEQLLETIQPRNLTRPVQATAAADYVNFTEEDSVRPGSLTVS